MIISNINLGHQEKFSRNGQVGDGEVKMRV